MGCRDSDDQERGMERCLHGGFHSPVVVGDAINEINIHSGEIKKVKAVTGISDTKGMMALALTNVLSAAVTIGFNSQIGRAHV